MSEGAGRKKFRHVLTWTPAPRHALHSTQENSLSQSPQPPRHTAERQMSGGPWISKPRRLRPKSDSEFNAKLPTLNLPRAFAGP